eukprot:5090513-Amphidinium_carterae.1
MATTCRCLVFVAHVSDDHMENGGTGKLNRNSATWLSLLVCQHQFPVGSGGKARESLEWKGDMSPSATDVAHAHALGVPLHTHWVSESSAMMLPLLDGRDGQFAGSRCPRAFVPAHHRLGAESCRAAGGDLQVEGHSDGTAGPGFRSRCQRNPHGRR